MDISLAMYLRDIVQTKLYMDLNINNTVQLIYVSVSTDLIVFEVIVTANSTQGVVGTNF